MYNVGEHVNQTFTSITRACTRPLFVPQVHTKTTQEPSNFRYKFTVPVELLNDVSTDLHAVQYSYTWRYRGWTECTKTCDGGE